MNQQQKQQAQFDIKTGMSLRTERIRRGLTLKFVAGKLGITSAYLSDLEHGRRHWNKDRASSYLEIIGVIGEFREWCDANWPKLQPLPPIR